ncbi:AAA family ATPase [Candidatus Poribacteria bacterium]|nr:AAA family ATPase [Candidatus Poribacteria bacterium]
MMQSSQSQTHEFQLEDYFWIVFRSRWSILAILAAAIWGALLKNDTSTPFYEATAKIWVQEGNQKAMPFMENLLMPGLGRASQLQTFREIILTRTIVEEAVRELRAEGLFAPLPVHRGKFMVWITNRLGIKPSNKTEQGDLTVEVWEQEAVKSLLKGGLKVEPSREADIITISVRQQTPERAQNMANKIAEVFQGFIQKDMQKRMKVTEQFATNQLQHIKGQLETTEKQLQEFQVSNQTINLDAEAQMIIENVGQLDIQKTQLTQKLEGAKAQLKSLTDDLSQLSQQVISAETLTDNPNVTQLEGQLHADSILLAELKHQYPALDHPQIQKLETRIRQTKEEIAREDQKKVISQTTTLNPIHQELKSNIIGVLAEIRSAENQLLVLNQRIQAYEKLMEEWPEKQLELARLKRKVLLDQELFSALESTRQEASIASAAELGSVKILEAADKPNRPIRPRKTMNLALGILVGLTLGIGLAFLRTYFDNTYPTLEEAQRQLESLPEPHPSFLGMIPAIEGGGEHRIPLITHDAPKSGAAEALRILRTKLQFLNPDSPLKTILVTSSVPGEGKSTIASNLAVTLAQMNKKVLLVDADMRRPIQHKTFTSAQLVHAPPSLPSQSDSSNPRLFASVGALEPVGGSSTDRRKPGLSELLIRMNEGDALEALNTVVKQTEVENLYLITSGTIPPNPAELVNSDMMHKLIELLRREYDYVVFDSPPVRAVADPIILSTQVDAIIFVFDIAKTRKFDVISGLESLTEAAAGKIGAVCNLTEAQQGGYYGYGRYGYSKYGYYSRYRYSSYYYYYYDSKADEDDQDKKGNA